MSSDTNTEHMIRAIASAAQVLRDAHPSHQLSKIECGVASILNHIESELIAHHLIFEATDVRDLRENLLGVWHFEAPSVVTANALLLLKDVCTTLTLDESQTKRALSLADWCDAQHMLDSPIEAMPVLSSLPLPMT